MIKVTMIKTACGLFLILMINAVGFAQSEIVNRMDSTIDLQNTSTISFDNPLLQLTTIKDNSGLSQKFQLSFLFPLTLASELNKTSLKITAFSPKGKVLGMSIWHSLPVAFGESKRSGMGTMLLDLNPELSKAARFTGVFGTAEPGCSDNLLEPPGGDCAACTDSASAVCGTGRVASVKCSVLSTGYSCEFTCKP